MNVRPAARFLISLLVSSPTWAAVPSVSPSDMNLSVPPMKPLSGDGEWVFSLLPKSLQKNPRLEITVVTEMTEAGKKLPPPSATQPVFYETHSAGLRQFGEGVSTRTLPVEEVERLLKRSLATNGFLPAERPARPPSLLIIYFWGAHNDVEGASPEQKLQITLERAALVGGDKYARRLAEVIERTNDMQASMNAPVAPGGEPVMTAEMMAFASPIAMFRRESAKTEYLVDQTAGEVYYVTASAYDYAELARNRRVLLWRTRMTVASSGVAQDQTMPTLILTAAPFFGRDMPEAEIVNRRTIREGSVEIGTPTVVPAAKSGP